MYNNSIQVSREIKIVWKIFSLLLMIVLISLFFLDNDIVLSLSPKCTSFILYNKQCFLCGTTRAFIEIKNLNFNHAFILNKFSIFLFFIFLLNSVFFIYSLKRSFYEDN